MVICLCGLFTFLLTVIPTLLVAVVIVFKSSVTCNIQDASIEIVCNAL